MHLMCLLSGKVKIYKDGVGGRSQIIRVIKNKEYFAYRAYFAEENFVTAAAAFEPCTMCLIPMPVIIKLIQEMQIWQCSLFANYQKIWVFRMNVR